MTYFIGIDLAWGNTNPSAVSVIDAHKNILEVELLYSLDSIVTFIKHYCHDNEVAIGVDAPLHVNNETGNRTVEVAFLKDFSRYKIGMLPVNRTLMLKQFGSLRGEELFFKLQTLGFEFSNTRARSIIEVYPHSTIAVCFNKLKILPYKRKKGRSVADVKEAMQTYQNYLQEVFNPHEILNIHVNSLKGKSLKEYEDRLDAITSAYTLYYCKKFPEKCKCYGSTKEGLFITPHPDLL